MLILFCKMLQTQAILTKKINQAILILVLILIILSVLTILSVRAYINIIARDREEKNHYIRMAIIIAVIVAIIWSIRKVVNIVKKILLQCISVIKLLYLCTYKSLREDGFNTITSGALSIMITTGAVVIII